MLQEEGKEGNSCAVNTFTWVQTDTENTECRVMHSFLPEFQANPPTHTRTHTGHELSCQPSQRRSLKEGFYNKKEAFVDMIWLRKQMYNTSISEETVCSYALSISGYI